MTNEFYFPSMNSRLECLVAYEKSGTKFMNTVQYKWIMAWSFFVYKKMLEKNGFSIMPKGFEIVYNM